MFNPNRNGLWLVPGLMQNQYVDFHRNLLLDSSRTLTFKAAILSIVRPGDIVADVGAGTGILSLFAVQAGARRVYAIEAGPIAALAEECVALNNLTDKITVLRANSFRVTLPMQVDVVVSECIGWMMYVGDMFAAVTDARERLLRPGGRVIPAKVRLFAAPVESLNHYCYARMFGRGRVHGFDLSCFGEEDNAFVTTLNEDALLAAPRQVAEADLLHGFPNEAVHATVEFTIERDSTLHGFGLWFDADLCDGVRLSTAPGEPPTIWQQVYLGCGEELPLERGSTVTLSLDLCRSVSTRFQCLEWRAVVSDPRRAQIATRTFRTLRQNGAGEREWRSEVSGSEWLGLMRSAYGFSQDQTPVTWRHRLIGFLRGPGQQSPGSQKMARGTPITD